MDGYDSLHPWWPGAGGGCLRGRGVFCVSPHGSVQPGVLFCIDIVLFADEILQKQVQYFIMFNSFLSVSVTLK